MYALIVDDLAGFTNLNGQRVGQRASCGGKSVLISSLGPFCLSVFETNEEAGLRLDSLQAVNPGHVFRVIYTDTDEIAGQHVDTNFSPVC